MGALARFGHPLVLGSDGKIKPMITLTFD